jgi:hypothetical protein
MTALAPSTCESEDTSKVTLSAVALNVSTLSSNTALVLDMLVILRKLKKPLLHLNGQKKLISVIIFQWKHHRKKYITFICSDPN